MTSDTSATAAEASPGALKSAMKRTAYRSGSLSAYHRVRNRRTITVVMFHRVLRQTDARWSDADPCWTVSEDLFGECIDFFTHHYNVIGIDHLARACETGCSLPDHALLITFDDGWADNEEYALRILSDAGLPAMVFVTTQSVGGSNWQEELLSLWRRGMVGSRNLAALRQTLSLEGDEACPNKDIYLAMWRLAELDQERRSQILALAGIDVPTQSRASMLSVPQMRRMQSAGVAIGSHGLSHCPITECADMEMELAGSRAALANMLGLPEDKGPVTFSFPHGLYNTAAITAAGGAGYRLLFTSDACLNPCPSDAAPVHVFGRINIPGSEMTDGRGRLRPELLAIWLFTRTVRHVG